MLPSSFGALVWACLGALPAACFCLLQHFALIQHEGSVLELLVSHMLLLLVAETEVILLQCFTECVTAL